MKKLLTGILSLLFAAGIGSSVALAIPAENPAQTQTEGTAHKTADDFFSATKNAEIITDYQTPAHIGNYKGIFVKASENGESVVTLNHTLDLRMFTKDDNLITMIPVTTQPLQERGDLEITEITVRFTDVEDEDIFVEMNVQRSVDARYPYGGAASGRGNGQILTGWNYEKMPDHMVYFSNSEYGRNVCANFYGRVRTGIEQSVDIRPVSFMYDYENASVHVSAYDNWNGSLVADLKDSEHMKGAWSGFKSGLVNVTITAESENYNNKDSGYVILDFAGLDFSQDSWTDTEAPALRIDTLGYDADDLPPAEVFKKYPVYQAICFDKFDGAYGLAPGEKPVSIEVISPSGNKTEITDGYFLPTETGTYRIYYRAEDAAGNRAESVFEIQARNFSEIMHRWNGSLPDQCTVGEEVAIPGGHLVAGAYGEYDVSVRVNNAITGEECPIAYGCFTPQIAGTYAVRVSVQDFLGRKGEFVYYVRAEADKEPVLEAGPSIPGVFILGKQTSLPDFKAFDYYSFAGVKADAEKIYTIRNAAGEILKQVKPNEKFTPDASFGDKVTVEYSAKSILYNQSLGGMSEVAVIDRSENINFARYFIQKNITGTQGNYSDESSIAFFFENGEAEISYGQTLLFNGMDISFRVPHEARGYDTIYMTVTDGSVSGRSVVFTIKDSGDAETSEFNINGEKTGDIFGTFDDSLLEDFQLRINAGGEIIDARGNSLGTVSTYSSGRPFEGFTDNLCYVTFSFGNVTGASAFQVVKIGSQYFDATVTQDYIGPDLQLARSFGYEQQIGEIRLPGAIGVDVLYGRTDVVVDVYAADGFTLLYSGKVGTDDVLLTIGKSGKYSVRYTTGDDKGNVAYFDYIVSIYDNQPFSVTLSGEVPEEVSLNSEVTLPSYTVDSRITDYDAIVFVMCPKGGLLDVTDTLSFTAMQQGNYKIYYYVVFETENSYLYNLTECVVRVN